MRVRILLLSTVLLAVGASAAHGQGISIFGGSLPKNCANGEVPAWNTTTRHWECYAVTGSGLGDVTASGTLALNAIALGGGTTVIKTTTTGTGVVTFLGTPSMANLGSMLTDEGTGVITFLTTPSSANLFAALTDETGSASGALAVFSKAPVINNPVASSVTDAISLAVRRNGSSQTANLVEFQTEANAFLSGIDKAGNLIIGATNPADSGVIRLENAALIAWENATPGTDLTLTVDSGNLLTYSGIVNPASLGSGSSITTKFLRGDSTWQTVSGAITGTDTQVLSFVGTDSPAGDAGFTYNASSNVATLTGGLVFGSTGLAASASSVIKTDTTTAHTLKLQGYDVNGTAYVDFITITNGDTPTMDLNAATTFGGAPIVTLTDPAADKILYWRDSDNTVQPVTIGAGLALTSGTLATAARLGSLQFVPGVTQAGTASLGFSTPSSGAATVASEGTTVAVAVMTFPDANTAEVQGHFKIPTDWDGTAMTLTGRFRSSATSGNAIWQLSGICGKAAAVIPTAYSSTPDTATVAASGTTLQEKDFSITLSVASNHSMDTCAAGDELYFRFFRDPSGSDTLGADAAIIEGLLFTWSKS